MYVFRDHFSDVAGRYAAHRPGYPVPLYEWLASLTPARDLAWDCATGSGQAARGLAAHFDTVVATDAAPAQVAHAQPHPRVRYAVAEAGRSDLAPASVALVTVAQALHWFDLEAFYAEVARVLVPGGVLAVWTYNLARVTPAVDAVIDHFYSEVVNGWWPAGREHVEEGYRRLPFPYPQRPVPAFAMHARWDLAALIGYLRTWSAVQRFREARSEDPVAALIPALQRAWGESSVTHEVRWPLTVRVGRAP